MGEGFRTLAVRSESDFHICLGPGVTMVDYTISLGLCSSLYEMDVIMEPIPAGFRRHSVTQ